MIRLSVKGTKEQAAQALLDRKLPGEYKGQGGMSDGLTSFWDVDEHYSLAVGEWFAETKPTECAPFKIGTLLHYR